jgi:thymidylate synthase
MLSTRYLFDLTIRSIEDFQVDDFVLENYNPHPKIDMTMAV